MEQEQKMTPTMAITQAQRILLDVSGAIQQMEQIIQQQAQELSNLKKDQLPELKKEDKGK